MDDDIQKRILRLEESVAALTRQNADAWKHNNALALQLDAALKRCAGLQVRVKIGPESYERDIAELRERLAAYENID